MKHLWYATALILFLFAVTLINVRYLNHFTNDLSSMLLQAQQLAEENKPLEAEKLTREAQERFDRQSFYLHVTLPHQSIDAVKISFHEVLEYLQDGDSTAVYTSTNAKLLTQLQLLSEAEQLTFKNVF